MGGTIEEDSFQVNVRDSPLNRGEREGDRPDRSNIVRHLIPGRPVAAGGGVVELAVAVDQRDRDAVDLGFHRHGDVFAAEAFPETLVEIDQLGFGNLGVLEFEDIVDAEHRDEVTDLLETFQRSPADAPRRGFRVVELRMRGFELLELAVKPVVVGVGDFRRRVLVVEAVVALQLGAEFADPGFGGGAAEKVVHGAESVGWIS